MNFLLHSLPVATLDHDTHLIIIFAFVIAVVAIRAFVRSQQDRRWHETARVALEKGQPVPQLDDPRVYWKYRRCGRRGAFPRGIIMIAVGLGLYFIHPDGIDRWWILPVFIGVAQLIVWGIGSAMGDGRDRRDDQQNPPR